jgi:dolichol kinase
VRLHRGGRFRRWLGARLGGDFALGDRVWRRILHGLGAAVLIYYPLPNDFFVVLPKEYVLLLALGVVLALELLRHSMRLELPTIRPYETGRVGSFAWFAVAIVAAILLFPMAIAAAVVLGCALVDPLAGELRHTGRYRGLARLLPFATYAALAFVGLAVLGAWPVLASVGLALIAAAIGVAVEGPRFRWVDDDLAMTLGPAIALYVVGVLALRY